VPCFLAGAYSYVHVCGQVHLAPCTVIEPVSSVKHTVFHESSRSHLQAEPINFHPAVLLCLLWQQIQRKGKQAFLNKVTLACPPARLPLTCLQHILFSVAYDPKILGGRHRDLALLKGRELDTVALEGRLEAWHLLPSPAVRLPTPQCRSLLRDQPSTKLLEWVIFVMKSC
jgi:hypothetical protein